VDARRAKATTATTASTATTARGLEEAVALDEADPLTPFHDRFLTADETIYLDGNSLGRLPKDTPERIRHVLEHEWGERLIRGWTEGWMELPLTVGDRLGAHLVGAKPGQTTIADSTTVCFYKLASAALDARPTRTEIITDRDNFPTDRYVLEGIAAQRGLTIRWIEADPHRGPEPEHVQTLIGERTALVSFSHVNYRSAYLVDLRGITEIAHEHGALTLWDLCHSAGVVPIALDDDGADLAVGCTYKYLNGGPGAPAFLYVRREHQEQLQQPIWGWLGRTDPFVMGQGYIPAPGITHMLSGTPPILALTAAAVGIELSIEAGIEAIREKSIKLTDYATTLIDDLPGCAVGSPRDPAIRGSHVALQHPQARELCERLADQGVIADFRMPDVIRLGLSPLTTRFVDIYDGLDRLRGLLA
jgi:kynureninase